ncbi:DoxX family protein [Phaeodactylibacter luteus]|uniref:DoxX family protein n=1 Tax=Phaeodactylibacter luteus TaxID=1564516 RepID=A0A5C6RJE6_9BACT|nr:DoxX family protein [Phaeodactylibacter luteus]TXB62441.1 DoxX family protein [Phaeodactylibacter luteus]
MKDILDLLGRGMLSFIFLYEAYDSIFYFEQTQEKMSLYGLEWRQDLLLVGAIILMLLGGTLLLIGYRTGLAMFLLLCYWIPVTFIVHSFWNDPEPARRLQSILFMKNIAIVGGLLMVWANGVGRYSVKRLFATTRVRGV